MKHFYAIFTCTKLYLILKFKLHCFFVQSCFLWLWMLKGVRLNCGLEYIYMPMFDGDAYDKKKKAWTFFSCITITGIFWIWCTNKYIQTKDLNSSTLVSSMQCPDGIRKLCFRLKVGEVLALCKWKKIIVRFALWFFSHVDRTSLEVQRHRQFLQKVKTIKIYSHDLGCLLLVFISLFLDLFI